MSFNGKHENDSVVRKNNNTKIHVSVCEKNVATVHETGFLWISNCQCTRKGPRLWNLHRFISKQKKPKNKRRMVVTLLFSLSLFKKHKRDEDGNGKTHKSWTASNNNHNLDVKLHFKILVGVNKYVSVWAIQYRDTAVQSSPAVQPGPEPGRRAETLFSFQLLLHIVQNLHNST